jgi:hypothetical protein
MQQLFPALETNSPTYQIRCDVALQHHFFPNLPRFANGFLPDVFQT